MKRSKYNNRKITIDGMTFDSVHEARRWRELKKLEKAGEIHDLERQVNFLLLPPQREPDEIGPRGGVKKGKLLEKSITYRADFSYIDTETGKKIVEDAKGVRTDEYKIKRKLMLWVYGIRIREV